MKQIRYRKLIIPANVQPATSTTYDLKLDNGTEEITLVLTRNLSAAYSVYVNIRSPSGNVNAVSLNGNNAFDSTNAITISSPTLFYKGCSLVLYLTQTQNFDITVDVISKVDTENYLYN